MGTVLSAREVMIIVNGHNKARALYHAVEGAITQMWTISALQMHEKGIIVCDDAATAELKVGTYRYFKDIEADHLDPQSSAASDVYKRQEEDRPEELLAYPLLFISLTRKSVEELIFQTVFDPFHCFLTFFSSLLRTFFYVFGCIFDFLKCIFGAFFHVISYFL